MQVPSIVARKTIPLASLAVAEKMT